MTAPESVVPSSDDHDSVAANCVMLDQTPVEGARCDNVACSGPEPVVLTDGEREAIQDSSGAPGRLNRKHFEAVGQIITDRLAAKRAAHEATVQAMHEEADRLASQRNALVRHDGVQPTPDDDHTSDGRCKYPASCEADAQRRRAAHEAQVQAGEALREALREALAQRMLNTVDPLLPGHEVRAACVGIVRAALAAAAPTPPECTCTMTPPETWLSAASCGYGSGYEPGSQWEWNPDCPAHPPTTPQDKATEPG